MQHLLSAMVGAEPPRRSEERGRRRIQAGQPAQHHLGRGVDDRHTARLGEFVTPEWIKTSAVMDILGKPPNACRSLARIGLQAKKARVRGVPGRKPHLYRSADIERVKRLMVEAGLAMPAAVRVVVAQNEGRL